MGKKATEEKATPAKRGPMINKIIVDYWKTKLHTAAMGIKKDLEYRAKDRHFTAEFELKGEVVFNDDTKGENITKQIIAFNKNDWEQKALERRLIIRTFTELKDNSGGRFLGGIELSTLESIQLSMSADKPLSSLVVILPDFDYLIRIYRMRKLVGDSFVFLMPPSDKENKFHFIEIAGKPGAGNDFNLKEGDEIIGDIDDKVLDFGGKFEISIKKTEYQQNRELHQVLILFCCAMKWLKEIEGDIAKIFEMTQKKDQIPKINFKPYTQELDLFKNPRRMNR